VLFDAAADPAEALLFDAGAFRFGIDKRRIVGTMTLAERVQSLQLLRLTLHLRLF
jgi:hypothetical protein